MIRKKDVVRSEEEIYQHYLIEKELARKLYNSTKEERGTLYSQVYDELFSRVPKHPQLVNKYSEIEILSRINWQSKLLNKFINSNTILLEIGAGDCHFAFEISKYVKSVIAIDVSNMITKGNSCPQNFSLIISDGVSIPVPLGSIDLVYSNQLMEHLHPDDALEQLKNIYGVLVKGGKYICITPNRLNGPHDVSKYYDKIAMGFHLKEYTFEELDLLCKKGGFCKVKILFGAKGNYLLLPVWPLLLIENFFFYLPNRIKDIIKNYRIINLFLNIKIVAIKT